MAKPVLGGADLPKNCLSFAQMSRIAELYPNSVKFLLKIRRAEKYLPIEVDLQKDLKPKTQNFFTPKIRKSLIRSHSFSCGKSVA